MTLVRCTQFFGRRCLIRTPPGLRLADDVVFVPFIDGRLGGLFEPSGRAVPESITYIGIPRLHTPQTTTSMEELPVARTAGGGEHHYFIGDINAHYGHFLVGAFARLWALPAAVRRDCRLVFSSVVPVDGLMRLDFFREMLAALGLCEDNLLRVSEPTRFDRITVPGSAFEELSLVHQDFARLMNRVGQAIAAPTKVTRPLVYLSKEKLERGIVRISNEDALTASLRSLGVEVVFPEQLSFRAQVALWAETAVMMGFSGSAMHTSGFLPSRTMMILAHGSEMWVNQVLIDQANRNVVSYLYADGGLVLRGRRDIVNASTDTLNATTDNFNATYEIRDPAGLAADMVRWSRKVHGPNFGTLRSGQLSSSGSTRA